MVVILGAKFYVESDKLYVSVQFQSLASTETDGVTQYATLSAQWQFVADAGNGPDGWSLDVTPSYTAGAVSFPIGDFTSVPTPQYVALNLSLFEQLGEGASKTAVANIVMTCAASTPEPPTITPGSVAPPLLPLNFIDIVNTTFTHTCTRMLVWTPPRGSDASPWCASLGFSIDGSWSVGTPAGAPHPSDGTLALYATDLDASHAGMTLVHAALAPPAPPLRGLQLTASPCLSIASQQCLPSAITLNGYSRNEWFLQIENVGTQSIDVTVTGAYTVDIEGVPQTTTQTWQSHGLGAGASVQSTPIYTDVGALLTITAVKSGSSTVLQTLTLSPPAFAATPLGASRLPLVESTLPYRLEMVRTPDSTLAGVSVSSASDTPVYVLVGSMWYALRRRDDACSISCDLSSTVRVGVVASNAEYAQLYTLDTDQIVVGGNMNAPVNVDKSAIADDSYVKNLTGVRGSVEQIRVMFPSTTVVDALIDNSIGSADVTVMYELVTSAGVSSGEWITKKVHPEMHIVAASPIQQFRVSQPGHTMAFGAGCTTFSDGILGVHNANAPTRRELPYELDIVRDADADGNSKFVVTLRPKLDTHSLSYRLSTGDDAWEPLTASATKNITIVSSGPVNLFVRQAEGMNEKIVCYTFGGSDIGYSLGGAGNLGSETVPPRPVSVEIKPDALSSLTNVAVTNHVADNSAHYALEYTTQVDGVTHTTAWTEVGKAAKQTTSFDRTHVSRVWVHTYAANGVNHTYELELDADRVTRVRDGHARLPSTAPPAPTDKLSPTSDVPPFAHNAVDIDTTYVINGTNVAWSIDVTNRRPGVKLACFVRGSSEWTVIPSLGGSQTLTAVASQYSTVFLVYIFSDGFVAHYPFSMYFGATPLGRTDNFSYPPRDNLNQLGVLTSDEQTAIMDAVTPAIPVSIQFIKTDDITYDAQTIWKAQITNHELEDAMVWCALEWADGRTTATSPSSIQNLLTPHFSMGAVVRITVVIGSATGGMYTASMTRTGEGILVTTSANSGLTPPPHANLAHAATDPYTLEMERNVSDEAFTRMIRITNTHSLGGVYALSRVGDTGGDAWRRVVLGETRQYNFVNNTRADPLRLYVHTGDATSDAVVYTLPGDTTTSPLPSVGVVSSLSTGYATLPNGTTLSSTNVSGPYTLTWGADATSLCITNNACVLGMSCAIQILDDSGTVTSETDFVSLPTVGTYTEFNGLEVPIGGGVRVRVAITGGAVSVQTLGPFPLSSYYAWLVGGSNNSSTTSYDTMFSAGWTGDSANVEVRVDGLPVYAVLSQGDTTLAQRFVSVSTPLLVSTNPADGGIGVKLYSSSVISGAALWEVILTSDSTPARGYIVNGVAHDAPVWDATVTGLDIAPFTPPVGSTARPRASLSLRRAGGAVPPLTALRALGIEFVHFGSDTNTLNAIAWCPVTVSDVTHDVFVSLPLSVTRAMRMSPSDTYVRVHFQFSDAVARGGGGVRASETRLRVPLDAVRALWADDSVSVGDLHTEYTNSGWGAISVRVTWVDDGSLRPSRYALDIAPTQTGGSSGGGIGMYGMGDNAPPPENTRVWLGGSGEIVDVAGLPAVPLTFTLTPYHDVPSIDGTSASYANLAAHCFTGDALLLRGDGGGWIAARDVRVGDTLRTHDGRAVPVLRVRSHTVRPLQPRAVARRAPQHTLYALPREAGTLRADVLPPLPHDLPLHAVAVTHAHKIWDARVSAWLFAHEVEGAVRLERLPPCAFASPDGGFLLCHFVVPDYAHDTLVMAHGIISEALFRGKRRILKAKYVTPAPLMMLEGGVVSAQ